MCARCSGGRGGCGRVASRRRGRAERGKCGAAAGAPSFLSGVLVPAPRRREREGERAGCSQRGPRRGCPRCLGRRQQVGQPGWPGNISSACGLPGSGLPVPGLSVPAPPSRVTPQAACSGGNFAGASRRRSWARLCGSGEPRARGFPEKGSPGAGRAVGAGSLARLALVGVIPRFVAGRRVLWEGVWEDSLGLPASGKPWNVPTFRGKWKWGFSNYLGAKLGMKKDGNEGLGWRGEWWISTETSAGNSGWGWKQTNNPELGIWKIRDLWLCNSVSGCVVFYNQLEEASNILGWGGLCSLLSTLLCSSDAILTASPLRWL